MQVAKSQKAYTYKVKAVRKVLDSLLWPLETSSSKGGNSSTSDAPIAGSRIRPGVSLTGPQRSLLESFVDRSIEDCVANLLQLVSAHKRERDFVNEVLKL